MTTQTAEAMVVFLLQNIPNILLPLSFFELPNRALWRKMHVRCRKKPPNKSRRHSEFLKLKNCTAISREPRIVITSPYIPTTYTHDLVRIRIARASVWAAAESLDRAYTHERRVVKQLCGGIVEACLSADQF
jgi:hypothetical protein